MGIIIRRAMESDAVAACDVVRRSISELCVADHCNNEATLTAWLENKSVDTFLRLIRAESKSCVVAILDDNICGFGHIDHSGAIGLLYVAPDARFLGASTAMLGWLEDEAFRLGVKAVTLNSSLTAREFYMARGYALAGEPIAGFGITQAWPMSKQLTL